MLSLLQVLVIFATNKQVMQKNISLKNYNTFGIDVKADWLAKIESEEQLLTIIDDLPDMPKLILGGGSNVLFLQDFKGIVLHNEIKGISTIDEDDKYIRLYVKGGENWHDLVMWTVNNNYGGIENLALIPGKTGTAPIQNIGAYGVEIKDVVTKVHTIDMQNGTPKTFDNKACEFGYRQSVFKKPENKGKYFINAIEIKLQKKGYRLNTKYGAIQQVLIEKKIDIPTIKDVAEAVMQIRRSKLPDPKQTGNAGSFFKNPFIKRSQLNYLQQYYPDIPFYPTQDTHIFKIPAGWLIDQAGWKGKRFGNVGVHPAQALVLVNYGGAKGIEIKNLAERITEDIFQKFGIYLHPEVNYI